MHRKVRKFIEDKGVEVVNIELMTKWSEAKTHSFKITIKAKYLELTKTINFWPYRVGVRFFKTFKPKVTASWESNASSVRKSNNTSGASRNTFESFKHSNVNSVITNNILGSTSNNMFLNVPKACFKAYCFCTASACQAC